MARCLGLRDVFSARLFEPPPPTSLGQNEVVEIELVHVLTEEELGQSVGIPVTYTVTYAGLTPIAGHFHKGAVGVSGPVSIVYPSNLASPITATLTLSDEQADALKAGLLYANLHTQANPSGEIRANVVAK